MNTGIYYLYEYESGHPVRNIGFLRIAIRYRSCALQVQARGIPPARMSPQLCAFYMEENVIRYAALTELECPRRMVSAQVTFSDSSLPEGMSVENVSGFFIHIPGEKMGRFWAASERELPSNIEFRPHTESSEENASPDAVPHDDVSDEGVSHESVSSVSEGSVQNSVSGESASAENVSSETSGDLSESSAHGDISCENVSSETSGSVSESSVHGDISCESVSSENGGGVSESSVQNGVSSESVSSETSGSVSENSVQNGIFNENSTSGAGDSSSQSRMKAQKIRHEDIASLPRRFWPLANNSFLMHGYHNYDHLLLVEENGHLWLGVPGTYDAHEARAADLFGFPQFTRDYVSVLNLEENERSDSPDFGHWCRCIGKRPSK